MSNEIIFGEMSGIYRDGSEKLFHDEGKAWEKVLGRATESPEWYAWWTSTVDITVKPGSFVTFPSFTLKDAGLKPRFSRMKKYELETWLTSHGFNVPDKVTRVQLIDRAERVWDDNQ